MAEPTGPDPKPDPKAEPKAKAKASDLSPSQLAAAAYELRPPASGSVEDGIWGAVASDQGTGVVVGAEPGWDHRWLTPTDFGPDGRALHQARQGLVDRGFAAISGPCYSGPVRKEFVAGRPGVELWRRPSKIADEEWRALLAKSCLDERWASQYWRRCCSEGAPQTRYLPEALEYAMLVIHGLAKDVNRLNPTREHVIALARRAPVHPLGVGPGSKSDPLREAFAQLAR